MAKNCTEKEKQTTNKITKKDKKKETGDQESFSNYLRVKDCRWCNRTYNSAFTCAGCGHQWAAKTKAEHCLDHCVKFAAASAKEKGEMVMKGGNCLICLHHEHATDSCFGKEQQRTICGMGGCQKRHHPSLHSAPQGTIQAVQALINIQTGQELGYIDTGVREKKDAEVNFAYMI